MIVAHFEVNLTQRLTAALSAKASGNSLSKEWPVTQAARLVYPDYKYRCRK